MAFNPTWRMLPCLLRSPMYHTCCSLALPLLPSETSKPDKFKSLFAQSSYHHVKALLRSLRSPNHKFEASQVLCYRDLEKGRFPPVGHATIPKYKRSNVYLLASAMAYFHQMPDPPVSRALILLRVYIKDVGLSFHASCQIVFN